MKIRVDLTIERPRLPAGPRRRSAAVAAVLLAVLLPSAALANHIFADVPAADPFHQNISNVANAGVAAGCGGGKYCPDAAVTREQMAAFLNRGLGRVAEAPVQMSSVGTGQVILGQLTITPGIPGGAVVGAKQFMRAEISGSVRFTNISNCPCTLAVYLTADGSPLSQVATATTVTTASTYWPLNSSGVIQVTGTQPVTVRAVGYYVGGATATTAYTYYGTLDAELYPFGSTGGNVLAPAAAGPSALGAHNPLAVPRDD